jgi:hypothetical protein
MQLLYVHNGELIDEGISPPPPYRDLERIGDLFSIFIRIDAAVGNCC